MLKSLLIVVFCCLLIGSQTFAQQGVWDGGKEQLLKVKDAGNKNVKKIKQWKSYAEKWGLDSNFNYALAISGRLNTNGWSGGIQFIHQKKHQNRTIYQVLFSEIKHEKEIKQQGTEGTFGNLGKTSPYIFGKINNAYTLQLGFGKEQVLFPSIMDGNMSLSIRYLAGPSLAMLKPYYLKLIYVDYFPNPVARIQSEKYSVDNDSHFMQPGDVLGKDSWSKGLGQIKYIPGAFAECYFVIEPDRPKAFIKSVYVGGNVAFYSSKIEIMADKKAYPYEASFFVGLSLGKRWK
jgi:hypothetical protein